MDNSTRKPTRLDTVCNNYAFIHNEALRLGLTVNRGRLNSANRDRVNLLSVSINVLHNDFELLTVVQGSDRHDMSLWLHSLPSADKIAGATQGEIRHELKKCYAYTARLDKSPTPAIPLSTLTKDDVTRFLNEAMELRDLLETEYAKAAITATREQLDYLCSNS